MGLTSLQANASQPSTVKSTHSRECPACGRTTAHAFCFRVNGCDILQCTECGLGRTETPAFDPAAYYTEEYFSGRRADGYADYLGAEPVLRREFARSVDFIRRYRSAGKLLELGCAYGFFLKEAARYFDVAGLELAPDAAAASVVLHAGEHAALVRRARACARACRSSLEDRSGLTRRVSAAADPRLARRSHDHRQPERRACQPVRCHARCAAQAGVKDA